MSSKIEHQTTDKLLMVSPDQFGFNPQTADTNGFQHKIDLDELKIRDEALKEFNKVVETLRANEIDVIVLPSREDVVTPDAVFPNNWVSFHDQSLMVIYPMRNKNRQDERQEQKLRSLLSEVNIVFDNTLDLSKDEEEGKILEGTGSVVLDRANRVAFAMESPRTTKEEFEKYCNLIGFEPVFFHAYDKESLPIYHTNVIMSVGESFAVICSEAITDFEERDQVLDTLDSLGKDIVEITLDQVYQYCGNILQVCNKDGLNKIIMSQKAFNGFTEEQKNILSSDSDIVVVEIPTIETVGGGSARCMLAEVFA
jgi:hypothetical protein